VEELVVVVDVVVDAEALDDDDVPLLGRFGNK